LHLKPFVEGIKTVHGRKKTKVAALPPLPANRMLPYPNTQ
jgi:hypothetical protein